jgi:pimeloyl-ACP methyl ester carboxylesterase
MAPARVERVPYDEFSMFHENAEEFGIPYPGPPTVRREAVEVEPGPSGRGSGRHVRRISALVWGEGDPELVLLHGGAQNAHTWDTVALALDRPLVALDLPGHGHSDSPRGGFADVSGHALDMAAAVRALASEARCVVGMSLGGMTALGLAAAAPDLVRSLVLVDVTPGVDEHKAASITAFISGPESFPSFDEILARTVEFNPTRTVSSLRRGILHNALQREDGNWVWRYARHRGDSVPTDGGDGALRHPDFGDLWDTVSGLKVPLMLVRGMLPQSVVDDADEAELLRRCPGARVEHVEGAGHSVQGDKPVELAHLIADFVA